ncbi:beta-propeller domain-containing protein [Pseudoalteromonas sp. T1lg23B]|uniref:beta-propeller domain-containing protein n=1 Tax=Pseudoalteromonas sp. T1lg23B TaxID=2077097 RepID=UPI000CF7459D|nr:beta-propeller domain-containing protein [Pseudoalteromonas sp. T1lg23B]
MFYPRLLAVGVTVLLSACSSDNENSNDNPTTIPKLNDIKVSTSPLTKASSEQFSNHLKNGLFMNRYRAFLYPDSLETDSPTTTGDFSVTNQQEQGVDEADRVKYDGQYMYVAANSAQSLQASEQYRQFVRIMKRDTEGNLTQVNDVTSTETAYQKQRLYLTDNTLTVLSHDNGWFGIAEPAATGGIAESTFPAPTTNQFEFSMMDVTTPEQVTVKAHYTIEGILIDSRVIDNHLYLVSNYYPQFEGFTGTDDTQQSKLKDYQAIQKEHINQLLPKIKNVSTGESALLFNTNDCYINNDATELDGFNAIMTITKVSLSDPTQRSAICVNTQVDGLYASSNTLYTFATNYSENDLNSVIHKFDLTDSALNYVATGEVSGHFGWRNENLRFSELGQYLRVVTSNGDNTNGYQHKLRVLEQQGQSLVVTSELPNESFPTPLGKVNGDGIVDEDIYAVRFTDNRAFVVTFRQVDPLYVIDLSNMQMPKIAGALEIPGYSAYLHPINENLLLGVGQHVEQIDQDLPVIGQGAKVSLFDISDMTNPQQLSEHVFQDGYTAAENDYHAFNVLAMNNGLFRFTLPIESWHVENTSQTMWNRENMLAAFEVDTNTMQLNYIGGSTVSYSDASDVPYIWSGEDRAIIHLDDLYYIHGNYIWQSDWQTPEVNNGPL